MCYNFATFVLYLDVITLIYRENRLTSSETCLSAKSCKSKDLQDFFIIILACPSKRDSGFALAIELDDKGKGLVDWKEV